MCRCLCGLFGDLVPGRDLRVADFPLFRPGKPVNAVRRKIGTVDRVHPARGAGDSDAGTGIPPWWKMAPRPEQRPEGWMIWLGIALRGRIPAKIYFAFCTGGDARSNPDGAHRHQ